MRVLVCNWLFIKRMCTKLSFLLILFMFPIISYILKNTIELNPVSIKVGIYSQDKGAISKDIMSNLEDSNKSIAFVEYKSLDTMIEQVKVRKIECGYVFSENFSDNIQNKKLKNLLELYISPGSLVHTISSEYIFSEIFSIYSFEELKSYISNQDYTKSLSRDYIAQEIAPLYYKYLNSPDTFSFTYTLNSTQLDNIEKNKIDTSISLPDFILLVIPALVSILIMIGGFIGLLNLCKDSANNLFVRLPYKKRLLYKISDIFSACILTGLSGFASLIICDFSNNYLLDLFKIILYCLLCSIFYYMLFILVSNQQILCGFMPIFIIGSIIFSPIIIDFSKFVPFIKYISWLFLPTYFKLIFGI